jgi:trehalose utilization protein
MVRSYVKRNGGDVVYATPGLETLAIIVMAPVLMVVDVTLTWIRLYSDAEKARRNNSSL